MKVKRSGQGKHYLFILLFLIVINIFKSIFKLFFDFLSNIYIHILLVIDVKSLWDMDNEEGAKNAFAAGSKFDHLSPDHSTNLQKKVVLFTFPDLFTIENN